MLTRCSEPFADGHAQVCIAGLQQHGTWPSAGCRVCSLEPPPTLGNSPIGAQCRFSAASGIQSPEEVLKMRPSLVLATAADRNPAGLIYAGYILSADQACASLEARSVLPLPELFRVFDFSHRHLASTSSWKSLEKGVSPVELKQQQS